MRGNKRQQFPVKSVFFVLTAKAKVNYTHPAEPDCWEGSPRWCPTRVWRLSRPWTCPKSVVWGRPPKWPYSPPRHTKRLPANSPIQWRIIFGINVKLTSLNVAQVSQGGQGTRGGAEFKFENWQGPILSDDMVIDNNKRSKFFRDEEGIYIAGRSLGYL